MATEGPTDASPETGLLPPTATNQPNYPQMIVEAIESLNDQNGSNKSSISRYIEANYSDLPVTHSTLLTYYLDKMKLVGEIVMLKNNYMKPDHDAPPKRGRGRPSKPKPPQDASSAVVSPPRPRGRPPKPKDPLAPPPPPKRTAPTVTGKKRGRPPKETKPATDTPVAAGGAVGKRGRGRPPKVKPGVVPVGA
ncbi:hypothetical protein SAY86_008331 [Trapa natans]|uniref:H15 domain-containing protein n=1 Tax=Trapa natans TaxID=22666 RepID=A0AAN7KDL1_TRANT|nr:hypothetical protein SAY86_008331 [Trapa natans]